MKADDDKEEEHLSSELESETCSGSLGWVGGGIHDHLSSSAGRADETEEVEEPRTSVA